MNLNADRKAVRVFNYLSRFPKRPLTRELETSRPMEFTVLLKALFSALSPIPCFLLTERRMVLLITERVALLAADTAVR